MGPTRLSGGFVFDLEFDERPAIVQCHKRGVCNAVVALVYLVKRMD